MQAGGEVPTPQAGPRGMNGRVTKIWWVRAYGRRHAITITIEAGAWNTTWWVLWSHFEGQWQYSMFLERDYVSIEWEAAYGVVHREAVAADDYDLYIVQKEVEEHNMLVWLVYYDSGDCSAEEFEV